MSANRKQPVVSFPRGARRMRAALFSGAMTDTADDVAGLKRQILHNERIWAGFRQLEVSLIGAHSLRELVAALASEFPRIFPSVDCVTLACFDPEYELTRMLDAPIQSDAVHTMPPDTVDLSGSFVNITQESLRSLFGASYRPRLGACTREIQSLLFPTYPQPLGSMALAPLFLRDQLIGTLNQGSLDPRHFVPEAATDLLEHLAAVTSMCLDNAVSRERLRWYGLMDPLTGVANRRLFEHRLGDEIERWLRRSRSRICWSTSITSSASTTNTAITWAIRCCNRSPKCWVAIDVAPICWHVTVARSSCCCCRTRRDSKARPSPSVSVATFLRTSSNSPMATVCR